MGVKNKNQSGKNNNETISVNDDLPSAIPYSSRLLGFGAYFMPLAVICLVALLAHFITETRTRVITTQSDERIDVGFAKNSLSRDLANATSDLRFLAGYLGSSGFDENGELNTGLVTELFSKLLSEKNLYDQARFIGQDGQEILRVNFNDGMAEAVDADSLQNKADRYYVQEAVKLAQGQLYISPLDLNIELGEIERPLKPMMRFAMPVTNHLGERAGIVVLNYLGRKMLNAFSQAGPGIADHLHLLNRDGFWLSSPGGYEEWGFMLPYGKRFSDFFPETWRVLSTKEFGQFVNPEGAFTFTTMIPGGGAAETVSLVSERPAWKIVSRLPTSEQPGWHLFLSRFGIVYLILLLAAAVTAWLLSQARIRHRILDRQRVYEQRFRHTLEKIQMAAVEIDCSGKLMFCNAFFASLIGTKKISELKVQSFENWVPDSNDRQRVRNLLDDYEHPEKRSATRDIELKMRSTDGNEYLLSCHITPMVDSESRLNGLTILAEDVTGKREAEESVRRLSRIVEQSPSIVLVTNNRGNIEYVNPKFCEVTGYSSEEVQGQNPRFLKSGETEQNEYSELWQRVLAGREWRGEFHNRRKNGELYWESAIISGLRSSTGEITHFVAVKEDINERKRLEKEVEQQNRELARSQSLAEMGRVASMIAHDLRNPLSSVKMGLQIMANQPIKKQTELIEIGLDQVLHMEAILDDILNFVRPEAVRLAWINVDALLDRTIATLQKQIDGSDVALSVTTERGLASVPGDEYKLRQVFSNLIVNAIQAVDGLPEANRRVDVQAGMYVDNTGTAVKVTVSDNGQGVTPEVMEHLFEPFYTTKSKGTGLGLSIVAQIIEQHHGRAVCERNHDGFAISVTLPTTNAML